MEESDNAHQSHLQISPHGRNDTPPVFWFLLPNDSVKVIMVAPVCEQNVSGRVVYFPEHMKELIFKNGIIEEGKVYEKGFSYVEMQMGTVHIFLREGYLFPVAK